MAAPATILNGNDIGVFFNESLLQHIKQENNAEVLSAIQTADPCNLTSSLGTSLLHFAAKYGNKWLTKHLLSLGMNVDVKNRVQETPLMYAVSASRKETVMLLLEANADIFVPDANGECALAKALNGTVSENVLKLIFDKVTIESLSNSVHVNKKSFHESCPLYHFIPLRNVALTRLLLEKGSPIDVVNPCTDGETSLHLAVKQVDYQHVKLLLEFNANVNAAKRNEDHETPLALCCQDGDDSSETLEIVKTLLAAGAVMIDRRTRKIMVRSILSKGRSETIRVLLHHQLDLTRKDKEMTLLNYLASNSTPNILREVLECLDFDVNNCSPSSPYTMLHCAAMQKNSSSIKFLLERGAHVNAKYSGYGMTPLGGLIKSLILSETPLNRIQLDNSLECIDVLLEADADCLIFRSLCYGRPLASYEPFSDELIEILSPVIAHLALCIAYGIAINRFDQKEIHSCQQLQSIFDATELQFDEFKRIKINRYETLYDFLTMKDKKISLIARNSRLTSNLIGAVEKCNLKLHYNRRLRQQFLKFTQLVEMRKKVANAIGKIFMKFCDGPIENIAILVVNYLSDKDLHTVLSIYM